MRGFRFDRYGRDRRSSATGSFGAKLSTKDVPAPLSFSLIFWADVALGIRLAARAISIFPALDRLIRDVGNEPMHRRHTDVFDRVLLPRLLIIKVTKCTHVDVVITPPAAAPT
jgi:hypothetical protein